MPNMGMIPKKESFIHSLSIENERVLLYTERNRRKGKRNMKKKGLMVTLGVIAAVIIIAVAAVASGYNGMVGAQENLNTQKSNVETQLQRRADLIPNLVSTVKGYAAHEESIYTEIAEARAKLNTAVSSGDVDQMDQANSALSSALSRLLVIVENYPDLKASQNFINLQDELAGTENRITNARKDYNEAAQSYNKKIRSFPANMIAGMFGFESADYFQAQSGTENPPTVSFD